MSSNLPVSKTSPMIIRLFNTSPVKQCTTEVSPQTDLQSSPECSSSNSSRMSLKRKESETPEESEKVPRKISKCPFLLADKSEKETLQKTDLAAEIDCPVRTVTASNCKDNVKQSIKVDCHTEQKELSGHVLPSVNVPIIKQSTVKFLNIEKGGKSLSELMKRVNRPNKKFQSSDLKNKEIPMSENESSVIPNSSKSKILKVAKVSTVSIGESSLRPITYSLISNNAVMKVKSKSNDQGLLHIEKPTTFVPHSIVQDTHDTTLANSPPVPNKNIDNTVECGKSSESFADPKNSPLPIILPFSAVSLHVDELIIPDQLTNKLSEANLDIVSNVIPLSEIKVEKDCDILEESKLIKNKMLESSNEEDTLQVFVGNEYDNIKIEPVEDTSETNVLNQQSITFSCGIDLNAEIHKEKLFLEIKDRAMQKTKSSTLEDSEDALVLTTHNNKKNETSIYVSNKKISLIGKKKFDNSKSNKVQKEMMLMHSVLPMSMESLNESDSLEKNLSSQQKFSERNFDVEQHIPISEKQQDANTSTIYKKISPESSVSSGKNQDVVQKVQPAEKKSDLCTEVHNKNSSESSLLPEINLEIEHHIETPQFKNKERKVGHKRKKRHYRRHASDSEIDEEKDIDVSCKEKDQDTSKTWKDQMISVDDVCELEINELEKIRELLRQQLCEGNEDSRDTLDSSDVNELSVAKQPQTTDIELNLNESHTLNSKELDKSCEPSKATTSKRCFISNDNSDIDLDLVSKGCPVKLKAFEKDKKSPRKHTKSPKKHTKSPKKDKKSPKKDTKSPFKKLKSTKDRTSKPSGSVEQTEDIAGTSKKELLTISPKNAKENESIENNNDPSDEVQQDTIASAIDKPPLVMQSSNLLLNYGLDNRHGGGGDETTNLDVESSSKKRKRTPSDDGMENEDSQQSSQGVESMDMETPEHPLIVCEDSSSNPALDFENCGQNGLMEFDILDEFESDGNEDDDDNSSDSSSDEFDMDEIDAMLDEGLLEGRKSFRRKSELNSETAHEEKEKIVLKVRGKSHFDLLPEGWIEVTHNSGMPIYLHKATRVCCMSKPYFLGPGSTRKHEIPVSAIPCLHYQKEKEKENSKADSVENDKTTSAEVEVSNILPVTTNSDVEKTQDVLVNGDPPNESSVCNGKFPSASLEVAKDTKESGSLDCSAVRKYCEKRFDFHSITVKRFKTWSGRRKHIKQQKLNQRPFLPDSTKLITCPLYGAPEKSTVTGAALPKKEFIMNPSGKSPVCILHEYVQHILRLQPKYVFKELENARTPYGAVVVIEGIEYGCGYGSSKKSAKSDAARSALEILIPKMKSLSKEDKTEDQDLEFFDQVRVEDPRICDLSVKAGQPYPYQILLECIKRNYGMGETTISIAMKNIKHQKNEFQMTCGKHTASVICKNKRDGKHRASQAILQKLHPHINCWGSLLRMYGKGSCKTMKEKKEEEQQITELQSKATANKPNMSILCKLKDEMLKYREKVKSKKPIGKLIPERMEFPSSSNANLKNIEL